MTPPALRSEQLLAGKPPNMRVLRPVADPSS
jgi:hypothetical protein